MCLKEYNHASGSVIALEAETSIYHMIAASSEKTHSSAKITTPLSATEIRSTVFIANPP